MSSRRLFFVSGSWMNRRRLFSRRQRANHVEIRAADKTPRPSTAPVRCPTAESFAKTRRSSSLSPVGGWGSRDAPLGFRSGDSTSQDQGDKDRNKTKSSTCHVNSV
jgi:hypothetical protein